MNEHIMKALADLKDRQKAGEWMPCPRCGRDTMKPNLHTNALSRHAQGIYICDECGTAEAMLDFMNNPLPTEMWAMFRVPRPESDLKALPGRDVWERIGMAAQGVGVQIGLHGVPPAARAGHPFTGMLPGFQIGEGFLDTLSHWRPPPSQARPQRSRPLWSRG